VLISIHIPKSAGTSFRRVLESLYGDALWLNYGSIVARDGARPDLVPDGTACIHGHFMADAFDDLFPRSTLIAWLRDPVERVVSIYYHFLRSPEMQDGSCRALIENRLTLVEFAELDWMRNGSTRYLAGKPLEAFAFLGIAERYSDSLRVFSRQFCGGRALPDARDNTNPERMTERYPLAPTVYDRLLELNRDDVALYQATKERLDARSGPEP
jgi:hypothetical protein